MLNPKRDQNESHASSGRGDDDPCDHGLSSTWKVTSSLTPFKRCDHFLGNRTLAISVGFIFPSWKG